MEQIRCAWVSAEPIYVHYHDQEWGVPIRNDDHALFERLCLEGAQAGLSWITILRKRENYREAFDGFDPQRVAAYDEAKVSKLMANAGIVRNQLKIRAAINNARCFLEIQAEHSSFADYLWAYVDGKPIQNRWRSLSEIPSETDLSRAISKDLKRRGFKFVGSTICYAMMQAVGMVNDHTLDCFRHNEVAALADRL
ncbi:MAG: DNA-3-methyladenine glycosylase I [Phototrophicales bacterium]|nr:MAG: DNA-3-methyladenine glycosylase I [Phototrophicales bacterium]